MPLRAATRAVSLHPPFEKNDYMGIGYDWIAVFYPVIWLFLTGADPYVQLHTHLPHRFFNPPWLLPLLVPFGLLPVSWGAWALNAFTMAGLFALCAKHGKPWLTLVLALSYPLADLIHQTNVDGFVIWGLVIGGPVGIFLLSTKPQVAGLVGLIWSMDAYRQGGWRAVARLLGPTAVIGLVFTAIYPQWLGAALAATGVKGAAGSNFWPWLIPVGLWAAVAALRKRREDLAVLATNLLLPYLRAHSWIAALALVSLRYPKLAIPLAVLSWLLLVYLTYLTVTG